nr:MAG TPA: hypothetical protein [Bacteriophage sp.]
MINFFHRQATYFLLYHQQKLIHWRFDKIFI